MPFVLYQKTSGSVEFFFLLSSYVFKASKSGVTFQTNKLILQSRMADMILTEMIVMSNTVINTVLEEIRGSIGSPFAWIRVTAVLEQTVDWQLR